MVGKKISVVELSEDECRELVTDFYTKMILGDAGMVRDCILSGERFPLPNSGVNKLSIKELADYVGEFNLGEQFAKEHGAKVVVVRIEECRYEVVWDFDNLDPDDRLIWELDVANELQVSEERQVSLKHRRS